MTTYIYFDDLTKAEKEALKQMDKAMKVLSKRHWFFGESSDFNIIRYNKDGERALSGGSDSMDQKFVAATISGYDMDGGGW